VLAGKGARFLVVVLKRWGVARREGRGGEEEEESGGTTGIGKGRPLPSIAIIFTLSTPTLLLSHARLYTHAPTEYRPSHSSTHTPEETAPFGRARPTSPPPQHTMLASRASTAARPAPLGTCQQRLCGRNPPAQPGARRLHAAAVTHAHTHPSPSPHPLLHPPPPHTQKPPGLGRASRLAVRAQPQGKVTKVRPHRSPRPDEKGRCGPCAHGGGGGRAPTRERLCAPSTSSSSRAPPSLLSLPIHPVPHPQVQEVEAELVAPEVADSRRTFLRG
jgi:hypothetical protein